ncbi:uncharacterized protein LOC143917494 [Arctopsyche grandis]|uniref:uncharacterized protein LOC143917494 n=1 Tax=Arctopsyche grandis TaxID=121162 RepID=UPI00406D77C6
MAPLESSKTDNLVQIEWLTTFAFLGALCCAVVGIKLKWFRAQLTLDSVDGSESTVQVRSGVYRPYTNDIYSPSYREINESSTENRPQQIPNKPQVTIPSNPPGSSVTRPKPIPDPTVQGTSNGAVQKVIKPPNQKVKGDDKPPNQKVKGDSKTEKDKALSDKKAKLIAKAKKEREEKVKEEKRLKKEKEEKLKKEKEEKLQKEKEKKDKNKKGKKTSEPVASVTIDVEAVAATQNPKGNASTTPAVPPPRNPTSLIKNTRTAPPSNDIEPDSGFTSSWDMVAAHRQNLHREVKPPANNNLRSMASQNNAGAMARNNNLSKPSGNTSNPLANDRTPTVVGFNPQSRRISEASNGSNESDTEA